MNNITKNKKRKSLNEKNVVKIFKRVLESLQDEEKMKKYVTMDNAFIRNRKLPLAKIMALLFGGTCYSLTMYLQLNFKKIQESVTKQAYSKSRKNIDSSVFVDINNELINTYYSEYKIEKYNKKYILLAIDGTTLEIPNIKELREEYGHSYGQAGAKEVARASASCIYDSLNGLIINSTIEKYNTSERKMAREMILNIKEQKKFGDMKTLYLMDRGYFSYEMLSFFVYNNENFMFRVQSGNLRKHFAKMESNDEWVDIPLSSVAGTIKDKKLKAYVKEEKRTVKVRLTKVVLKTGEIEYLVSNIEDINYSQMKELYFKRWGIEINYNFLKNRVKVENFSGKSKVTVEQDFYGKILNANILYLIAKVSGKKNTEKHEYKPSMNIVSGLYEKTILQNIMCSLSELIRGLKKLIKQIKRAFIMKTPSDKSSPRKPNDKVRANKYFNNIRPN